MSNSRIHNKALEQNIANRRVVIVVWLILIMAFVLFFRLFKLQVVDHDKYVTESESNRIEYIAIPPVRGLIYDRQGNLLADNIPVFDLVVVKEQVEDLDATLSHLQQRIDLSDAEITNFRTKLNQAHRPGQPIVLKSLLTDEQVAKISTDRFQLPGVDIQANLMRNYPYGELMAHAVGSVRRISARDKADLDPTLYEGTTHIGKLGTEAFYEYYLHGEPGTLKVERDAKGRIVRVLERNAPIPGDDITLYLDADLQSLAYEMLYDQEKQKHRRGALVAIEVETGGILAMVSTPSYDPNIFTSNRVLPSLYNPYAQSLDLPFYDRSTNGKYPPASTIKPFMGIAGLQTGHTSWEREIADPGFFQVEGYQRIYRDWTWERYGRGHGATIDLHDAIVESCDVYFYDLAYNMTIDPLHEQMATFGFGQNLSLDVNRASVGINPSAQWKRQVKRFNWRPGDSVNMGIGQGYFLVTPLQMATATAVLANKGKWTRPRHVVESTNPELPFDDGAGLSDISLENPSDWDKMSEAMKDVIYGAKGTAKTLKDTIKYEMAGKTGTAQVVNIPQKEKYNSEELAERQRDHAWFIGYAPADKPKIAIAVIVENGESSGRTAAPIALEVMELYLDKYGVSDD